MALIHFPHQVFLNTAVIDTEISGGKLVSITAVQRTPAKGYMPYTENLSKVLPDWYSAKDSHRFDKTVLTLRSKVRPRKVSASCCLDLPHAF